MEGDVWKIFPGGKLKDRRLILFNDWLVLATPLNKKRDRFAIKLSLDIANVSFINEEDEEEDSGEAVDKETQAAARRSADIRAFNASSPTKAIAALIEAGALDDSPERCALVVA